MIKVLERVVEKVKKLSREQQEYAAAVLEEIVGSGDDVYLLSAEERKLVREGLDELDRGKIATQKQVRRTYNSRRRLPKKGSIERFIARASFRSKDKNLSKKVDDIVYGPRRR